MKVKVTTARPKGKPRSHFDVAHLQPLTNMSIKYQLPTPYMRYSLDKIFKLNVTMAASKVKSRLHHGVTHLHPNQCP